MESGQLWERFFDEHAPHYMENVFTRNTIAEVDFIIEELSPPPGSSLLDVGCGTGRHSVELALRGFSVTGLDQSAGMLSEARKAADEAGVSVTWVQGDAVTHRFDRQFDNVICLCEGAFGLLNAGDDPEQHDRAILRNINAALRPGGRLLMTTLNGYRTIREVTQTQVEDGSFDPVTMLHYVTEEMELPEGNKTLSYKERVYIPPELVKLLTDEGFQVEHLWGGTAGNWGRRKIELDEIEVMVVARKL